MIDAIRSQLKELRAVARSPGLFTCSERVSAWCPAEHLDHLAKVTGSVVRVLADENAKPLPRGISLLGRLVLRLGWIPRGRGKTPERLTGTRASAEEIEAALARLEQVFDGLPFEALRASRAPVVRHPKFGGLTPTQALRFVEVHTEHHLKIVRDILAGRR